MALGCRVVGFFVGIGIVLGLSGLLLGFLTWAHGSPRFAHRRISDKPGMKVPWRERAKTMLFISTLSLVAVLGSTYLLFEQLVTLEAASALTIAWQTIAVLLVYDFAYYFLHRGMHHKKLMRFMHGVHHRARNPTALESFYLHPIELLAGLGLLVASTLVVGPIHHIAFLIAFFVYSVLNIIVHSGLNLPFMAPTNFLTRKHHVHHQDDFAKNYSSLTPLPDLLFGTTG